MPSWDVAKGELRVLKFLKDLKVELFFKGINLNLNAVNAVLFHFGLL